MIELKDYKDFEDFSNNYKLDIPSDFNFAFDCVDDWAEREPDKTAMVWCDDDGNTARYSFADMKRRSDGAARFFLSLGIGEGDKVMLILRRHAHFWFAILGLMKIGAVAIPTTHHILASDIVYRANNAEAVCIVTTDDSQLLDAAAEASKESPSVKHLVRAGVHTPSPMPKACGEFLLFDEALQRFSEERSALRRTTKNEDMFLIYFTSGTTGMPKMVAYNHTYPLAHTITAKYWHHLHEGSLHLTLADTGWAKAAWGKLYGQWLCGAAVLVYEHEKLNAHRLLKVIEEQRVTSFCAPPTAYRVLLKANFANYDLSSLEYATSAGEPMSEELFEKFRSLTGLRIREAYGQSESVPIVMTPPYVEPVSGSIGLPNPLYDLRFLDENGEEVPAGSSGEMCIKCNPGDVGIFMGYYKNDALTAKAWSDGYYHTGDLAVRDENGFVWFIGRTDDIIKSAGFRIGPFEVESIVGQHPAVQECAVTGVPDPLRGQRVKASIILHDGYEPSDALAKEIRAFVKANAASYKTPRLIEFVTELPKTISGKVRRTELRKK
ncbi:MAG: AMP-binding protein [Clostridiales Family XIII bacterium]|jgi:acetyl-CoA synthetase|nr:AMP-binding protein [Clostridiales Family XIII bacterium]